VKSTAASRQSQQKRPHHRPNTAGNLIRSVLIDPAAGLFRDPKLFFECSVSSACPVNACPTECVAYLTGVRDKLGFFRAKTTPRRLGRGLFLARTGMLKHQRLVGIDRRREDGI
jgi:hypothetical protein